MYGGTAEANTTLRSRSCPCFATVPGDLAAAHREADEGDVTQVERSEECRQVVGEGVVAGSGLVGLAEPASVVVDHPVPRAGQRLDLVLPRLAAERPSVDQDHRAAGAAGVLVVQRVVRSLGPCSTRGRTFRSACGVTRP